MGIQEADRERKSAQTVYDKLKDINGKGGNLLLNVGDDGEGRVQPEAIAILKEASDLRRARPIRKNVPKITAMPGR